MDTNAQTLQNALQDGVISAGMRSDDLNNCDIVIVALHPKQTIRFILEHAPLFKKGSIVMDVCGIKSTVVEQVTAPLKEQGVHFVGTHPMAGREFSGYDYAPSKHDYYAHGTDFCPSSKRRRFPCRNHAFQKGGHFFARTA